MNTDGENKFKISVMSFLRSSMITNFENFLKTDIFQMYNDYAFIATQGSC